MKHVVGLAVALLMVSGAGCSDDDATPDVVTDADADADGDGDTAVEDVAAEDVAEAEAADDAAAPDTSCDDHCANGTQDCEESWIDCGGGCTPCEPELLLDERFRADAGCAEGCCAAGCTRTVEGGVSGEGSWTTDGAESRIVYDLGRAVDCGTLLVHVDNFNPTYQYQPLGGGDAYVEFIAMFDGSDGQLNHYGRGSQFCVVNPPCPGCTSADGDLSNRCRVKVNGGLVSNDPSCDWESAAYTRGMFCLGDYETDPTWDPQSFDFEVRWNRQGLALRMNGTDEVSYHFGVFPNTCYPSPKTPQLRYVTIGRPRLEAGGGWLLGPIYTRVELTQYDCSTITF
jgi:hypothetical protein